MENNINDKDQLLDPISTICRLILLNFKPPNTKIGIYDHALILQEPTMKQPFIRYYYGDNRGNISILYFVIVRLIKWYINDKEDTGYHLNIKKLVKYLCSALKILQTTYTYGNAVLTLQYYINLLDVSINDNFDDNMLPECIKDKENDLTNLLDYEKIKNLWNSDKINDICDLYDKCFNALKCNDEYEIKKIGSYVLAIDNLLTLNENEFKILVKSNSKG